MTTDERNEPGEPGERGRVTLLHGHAARGFGNLPGGRDPDADCVAVADGRVIDVGTLDTMKQRHAGRVEHTVDLRDRLLLPGLVNAHSHLELAGLGPRPYTGDFTSWVAMLLKHRPCDAAAVTDAVRRGITMSLDSGVACVGDIGGAAWGDAAAWQALQSSTLQGVYFPELIARDGERATAELARLTTPPGTSSASQSETAWLRRGVSPHAPYSTSRLIYEACARHAQATGCVPSTHLAETLEEAQFVAKAAGPLRALIESMGRWSDAATADYGEGLSPVRWMEPYLRQSRWLVAHCNYVSDADIALLAETGASVAYCPVASEYFGHGTTSSGGGSGGGRFRGHRYRDMLDAGVNVCLGTDSIVCQPPEVESHPPEVKSQPLGILPQMRRLYQRDRTDPALLLRMATTNGRAALRCRDAPVTLLATVRIDPADATDPLIQALSSRQPVRSIALADITDQSK